MPSWCDAQLRKSIGTLENVLFKQEDKCGNNTTEHLHIATESTEYLNTNYQGRWTG
jgi:hypothetical protein